jgi:hypothetical protein
MYGCANVSPWKMYKKISVKRFSWENLVGYLARTYPMSLPKQKIPLAQPRTTHIPDRQGQL